MLFRLCIITSILLKLWATPLIVKLAALSGTCFSDEIPKNTMISVQIKSQTPITFQFFAEGFLKDTHQDVQDKTIKYTTSSNGHHEICFTSKVNHQIRFSFEFLVGQKAQDWGSVTQLGDIQILTAQGRHATDQVDLFENEVNMTVDKFKERRELELGVSRASLYLSLFFLVSIGLFLYLQFTAIKKHLAKRKFT